ncbi:MAG: hypothetical protein DWH82_04745 [Planctomycetota bacterium]|nr:MAG: hypothetical protein DWH82_04745 [Planctomycetota bacterium]
MRINSEKSLMARLFSAQPSPSINRSRDSLPSARICRRLAAAGLCSNFSRMDTSPTEVDESESLARFI